MGIEPHFSRIQGGLYAGGWALDYETTVVPAVDRPSYTKLTLRCDREDTCDCSPVLILGDDRFAFESEEHDGDDDGTYFGVVMSQARLQRLSCEPNSSLLMCGEERIEMDWLRANLSGHLQVIENAQALRAQAMESMRALPPGETWPTWPVCIDDPQGSPAPDAQSSEQTTRTLD